MDFKTEQIDDQTTALEKLQLEKTNEKADYSRLLTFAVSKEGLLAVGFYDKSAINVYDDKGNFLYGYRFNPNDRRTYSLEYDNENLQIILWSSSRQVVTVKNKGESVEIQNIPKTAEFNIYLEQIHNSNMKMVNEVSYEMCNGGNELTRIFFNGYTQVVKKDKLGNVNILVDVSETANKKIMFVSVGIIILIIVVISVLIYNKNKKYKSIGEFNQL